MAFQGVNAATKERRAGQPPVLATADLDVNFTPQWLLPSKSPSSALPDAAKGLANPPWEPAGNKDLRWRADDEAKNDRWGTNIEKDGFQNQGRDKLGEPLVRGGKWKDDERENSAKRDLPRWGGVQDDAPRWNGGGFNRPQAEPALRNERWNDASRGRGRPLDEKWTRDRDNLGWLPGMGDEPSNRDKRWNEGGLDQFEGVAPEKWRAPGSSRDPVAHARGRGVGLGRAKPMFKGGEAADRWGSPVHVRNGPISNVVPGTKYGKYTLVDVYNTLASNHGTPLPLPETADTKLPGLISDELPELDNGTDGVSMKKKDRGSSSDEVSPEAQAPAQAYQPPFKRMPSQPAAPADRTPQSRDLHAPHPGGRPTDDPVVSLGLAKLSSKEVASTPPIVSAQAFAADQWIYKDPQGNIQGPFTKVDILDWFEAGFFPPELPIKSALDPADSPFVNLSSMLKMWAHIGANRAPPGFVQVPSAGIGVQGHAGGPESAALEPVNSVNADPAIIHQHPVLPDSLGLGQGTVQTSGLTGQVQGLQGADPMAIPLANNQQSALPDSNIFNQLKASNMDKSGILGGTTMHSPFQAESAGTPPSDQAFLVGSYESNPWHLQRNITPQQHSTQPSILQQLPGSLLSQQHSQPVGHAADVVTQALQPQHSAQAALSQASIMQQHPSALLHTSQPPAMSGLPSQPLGPALPYNQFSLHNAWSHATSAPIAQMSASQSQSLPQQFSNAVPQHQLMSNNTLHASGLVMADPTVPGSMLPSSILPPTVPPVPDLMPPANLVTVWSSPTPINSAGITPMQTPQNSQVAPYQPLAVGQALSVQPVQPAKEPSPPTPQQPAQPAQEQAPVEKPAQPAQQPQKTKSAATKAADPGNKAELTPASTAAAAIAASTDTAPFQEVSKRKKKQAKAAKAEATVAPPHAPVTEAPQFTPKSPEPAAAPEIARPETKPAPWAAAAVRAPAQKSLLEIQQEEEARLAAAAAANVAPSASAEKQPAAVPTPAPPALGWAMVASAAVTPAPVPVAAPPASTTRPSLREILEEEEKSKQAAPPAPIEAPVGTGPGPRGSTLGEILANRLDAGNGNKPAAPWASVSRPNVPSLRDVMFEESAADLEGGYVDEDLSDLLPHLQQFQQGVSLHAPPSMPVAPPAPVTPAQAPAYGGVWGARPAPARPTLPMAAGSIPSVANIRNIAPTAPVANGPRHVAPAAAHEEDEELFWDYGTKQAAAAAPAAKAAAPATAKVSAVTAAKAPAAAAKAAPAASLKAAARAAPQPAAAASRPPAANNGYNPPQQEWNIPEPLTPPVSEAPVVISSLDVSDEFQSWCKKKMWEFNGNEDLTLVEFLWSLPSGGEVAEYCQAYLGNGTAVSSFVAEFIKRKAAETARQKNKGKKKGGSGQANSSAAQASKPAQSKPAPAAQAAGDDGWHASAAKAKGKKSKGKKLDPKMLGFTSHYAVLATDD